MGETPHGAACAASRAPQARGRVRAFSAWPRAPRRRRGAGAPGAPLPAVPYGRHCEGGERGGAREKRPRSTQPEDVCGPGHEAGAAVKADGRTGRAGRRGERRGAMV